MRITVITVGKCRQKAVAELAGEYARRLPPGVKLAWVEVPAARVKGDPAGARGEDAARIRARIPAGARVAALAERGRARSSRDFAQWIGALRDRGQDLCFIIGPADGLDPALIADAHDVVSLSPLTFPHELVRVILAEQLYRAFSILRGEPYHRDG
jgi:23S rRNA (pseudouridine1915-N3)-methyltransferase